VRVNHLHQEDHFVIKLFSRSQLYHIICIESSLTHQLRKSQYRKAEKYPFGFSRSTYPENVNFLQEVLRLKNSSSSPDQKIEVRKKTERIEGMFLCLDLY